MDVSIEDDGQLRRLIADLGNASKKVQAGADDELKNAAERVQEDLNAQASGSRHFKGIAGSVTFERKNALGGPSYDVGPERGRGGGSLGHIFWLGGANGGGGTGDLDGALRREEPKLASAMGDIFGSLL